MISNLPKRIFLCGFMGAGKSVIGKSLAQKLDLNFVDLDEKVEEKAGQSIPDLFEDSGEAGFRAAERHTLLQVARDFEGIVALGGGSLHNQDMVDHLKLNGLLVFIETPISVILDRISQDENRPLLLDEQGNPKSKKRLNDELTVLYEERLSLYQQAEIKIENNGQQSVEDIVELLLKKIRNHAEFY
jgi:shikimate kinase